MSMIKRYPNRKLYDTDAKKYITLDEIAALVRSGQEVTVIDHESGEDVTSLTLTQIILEQEKKKSGYLSTSTLANLIRSGGATLGTSINDTIGSFRKSVQKSVASLGDLNPINEESINKLIEQGKLNVEQAQGLLKLDGLLSEVLHSLNVPTHKEIQALQEQVETLSTRLSELSIGEGEVDVPPLAAGQARESDEAPDSTSEAAADDAPPTEIAPNHSQA